MTSAIQIRAKCQFIAPACIPDDVLLTVIHKESTFSAP